MKKDQGEDVIKQCAIKHDLTDPDLEFMQQRIEKEIAQGVGPPRPNYRRGHRFLHLYRIVGKVTDLTANELISYYLSEPDYDFRADCQITCVLCERSGSAMVYFYKSQIYTIHAGTMEGGILGCVEAKRIGNRNFLKGELQDDHTIKYVEV